MNNKKWLIPVGIIAVLVLFIVVGYNGLVSKDAGVDNAYAQVQVVIKRRADLIPNLVNTVKGYAKHEEETLLKVVEARNKVTSSKTPNELAKADGELSKAISGLNVVVERYPELKANENYLSLQAQIEGTENRISTERSRYNEKVKEYNVKIKSFPTNILAKIFNFSEKEYFRAGENDQEAPKVNF